MIVVVVLLLVVLLEVGNVGNSLGIFFFFLLFLASKIKARKLGIN